MGVSDEMDVWEDCEGGGAIERAWHTRYTHAYSAVQGGMGLGSPSSCRAGCSVSVVCTWCRPPREQGPIVGYSSASEPRGGVGGFRVVIGGKSMCSLGYVRPWILLRVAVYPRRGSSELYVLRRAVRL